MGLSSKQVSGNAFDWAKNLMQTGALELPKIAQIRQQQQQVVPPLKCPRCDSSNTKFCYYNNYNRSQPRHYCKSCRRHWTKGGTLRNVPVGGGRKNKRQKTNTTNTNKNSSIKHDIDNSSNNNTNTKIQPRLLQQQQHQQFEAIGFGNEKNFNDIVYQSLHQPTSEYINNSYLDTMSTSTTLSLDSLLPLPNFSSTMENNPSYSSMSSRIQLPNVFNFSGKIEVGEDNPATTATTVPWQVPIITSGSLDPSTFWNWEDLNTLMSTDPKQPWVDPQN